MMDLHQSFSAHEHHLALFDSAGLKMGSCRCCLDLIKRMVLRVLTVPDGPQTHTHSFIDVLPTSELTVTAGVEQQSQRIWRRGKSGLEQHLNHQKLWQLEKR